MKFIAWFVVQLIVTAFAWEGVSIGIYLLNRASDAAIVVGCALIFLSGALGYYSTAGLWNLWRRNV
jgi:predicted N-acetyltransferase YhbS